MREKWSAFTWPLRILLLLQGILIVLFLVLYCTLGRQQILWYHDTPLRCRTEDGVTTYTGKVDGQKAVITVSAGPVMEYRLGDTLYGPYSLIHDPSAVPDDTETSDASLAFPAPLDMVGVEVWDNSQLLFRGSYLNRDSSSLTLYDENGEWVYPFSYSVTSSEQHGSTTDSAPSVYDILKITVAPEVVRRGHIEGFLLGTFLCLCCAGSILFADALFRFQMSFRIRYPEEAEPSEWELFGRWTSWILLTVLELCIFITGMIFH